MAGELRVDSDLVLFFGTDFEVQVEKQVFYFDFMEKFGFFHLVSIFLEVFSLDLHFATQVVIVVD